MLSVDLAVYADALAGEVAALAARAERARSRLRQAALERAARAALDPAATATLEGLGLLGRVDPDAARADLRDAAAGLEALESLQAWVEARLVEAEAEAGFTSHRRETSGSKGTRSSQGEGQWTSESPSAS